MKAFVVIIIVLIVGGIVYFQFVDPGALDKISGEQVSKSGSKFGMSEGSPLGTLKKLDGYLVDRLSLRKDDTNSSEVHYINDKAKRTTPKLTREIVLFLDEDNQVIKITSNSIFNEKRDAFFGADASFMESYWKQLTGEEKPDWEGESNPIGGGFGTNATARYSGTNIKGVYEWKTPGGNLCYRKMTIERTGNAVPPKRAEKMGKKMTVPPNKSSKPVTPKTIKGASVSKPSKDGESHFYLKVNYSDAEVELDEGKLTFKNGMVLKPGLHSMKISRDGCETKKVSFVAKPGVDKHLIINLNQE